MLTSTFVLFNPNGSQKKIIKRFVPKQTLGIHAEQNVHKRVSFRE